MIFHVVLLIMTSCMRRARREWLDAICRLIIWSTLSSQTSIPRDPLTATVQEDPPCPIWLLTTTADTLEADPTQQTVTVPWGSYDLWVLMYLGQLLYQPGPGSHSRTTVENLEMSAMGAVEHHGKIFSRVHSSCFAMLFSVVTVAAILHSRNC